VARINQGAREVSFDDTDDDYTPKTLTGFNSRNEQICATPPATQTTLRLTSSDCGGELIFSVEFDGQADGAVFTIDNFRARGVDRASVLADFPVTTPPTAAAQPTPPPPVTTAPASLGGL